MRSNAPTRILFFLSVLFIGIIAIWLWWNDAVAPVDSHDKTPEFFIIHRGEGVKSISSRIAQQRLVRSSTGFFILVKLLGIETQLQAGDYRINRSMNAHDIAYELTHGTIDAWVTTLEGWRNEEIAAKLSKDLDIPESESLKVAKVGYMFPDTYLIPRDATAGSIVNIFRTTFDQKVTPQMRTDTIKTGLTFDQVVTLASIIEREGRTEDDRPVIAGILLKRLKAGWPLQADSTLQFALGYQPSEKTWWKHEITNDDKKLNSLFNTYLHAGLPPTPIANPGLSSIKAVIYPTETEYWFYLHDKQGKAHFSKTLEEHNANIEKYLQ